VPTYMDMHDIPGVTAEAVAGAHQVLERVDLVAALVLLRVVAPLALLDQDRRDVAREDDGVGGWRVGGKGRDRRDDEEQRQEPTECGCHRNSH